MCRWITFLSSDDMSLSDLVLTASNSLVKMSYNAGYHPGFGPTNNSLFNGDGFGVGWYHAYSVEPALFKDILPAWSDSNLREVCKATRAKIIMAHVRAASPGSVVSRENCHPFKVGRLMYCHNGRIDGFWKIRRQMLESLTEEAYLSVRGTTDSEVAFAMILSNLMKDGGESPFTQKTPFGHDRLAAAMELTIQQIVNFSDSCDKKEFTRGFSTLNFALTDGETVIMSRFCDKDPNIPPPSLYFAFGEAEMIHRILGHGDATPAGPGDGAPMTRAEINKRIEDAMKDPTPLVHQESFNEYEDFVQEWLGRPTDKCAFVVSSDPLTFSKTLWHPVPANSILWCDKGKFPGMKLIEMQPVVG